MKICAIRGANSVKSNSKQDITAATLELFDQIIKQNKLKDKHIVCVIASSTVDLTEYYPATALRLSGCNAPLFSTTEPNIKDSLPLCVRLLVLAKKKNPIHIYLNKAKNLRSENK